MAGALAITLMRFIAIFEASAVDETMNGAEETARSHIRDNLERFRLLIAYRNNSIRQL